METRKSLHNALKEADHRGILTQRLIAIVLMATGAITFLGRERLAEVLPDTLTRSDEYESSLSVQSS